MVMVLLPASAVIVEGSATTVDCAADTASATTVTVSVRASGKAAYLFSGVEPDTMAADIATFVRLYDATPDGIVQDWISWIHPGTQKPDFHVPASFGTFLFENP